MKVNIDLNKSNPENYITDELQTNVGSTPFSLEHDFFFDGSDFQIWTGSGMTGTKLTEGADYAFTGKHLELSQRANGNVYQYVIIFTGTYQTGDLYFNYHACADYIEAQDYYSIVRTDGHHIKLLESGETEIANDTSTIRVKATDTGNISLESAAASSFIVSGANLSIGTNVSGNLELNSSGDLTLNDQYQTSAISLSEVSADGLSLNFAHDSQSQFNWTVRSINSPTSIVGAINSNRDDLYEYVELMSTQGATVGVAAGANLVGCSGISGITPTGKSNGADSNLQEMLEGIASTTTPLPVGTILMYDGAGWVDNDTIPGWYACTAANSTHGAPDLESKFIMGGSTSGTTGGNNSYSLAEGQLPSHTHSINHDHPNGSTDSESNHRHTEYENFQGGGSHGYIHYDQGGRGSTSYTGYAGGHSHTVYTSAYSGSSGAAGSGDSIDNRPAFYTMIYIRKCYS